MKIDFIIYFLTSVCFFSTESAFTQDIFLLEKPGKVRNIKFFKGDQIRFRLVSPDTLIQGELSAINDSDFVINGDLLLHPGDIRFFYKRQKFFRFTEELFLKAGIAYFGLTLINRSLNNQNPVIDQETALISGGLVVAGSLSALFKYRKFRIDEIHWRIRTLKRSISKIPGLQDQSCSSIP